MENQIAFRENEIEMEGNATWLMETLNKLDRQYEGMTVKEVIEIQLTN